MIALFLLVTSVFIAHGAELNECDDYQGEHHDSWLICNIFKNTNISSSIEWWNTTTPNYCNWDVNSEFDCSNGRIIDIDIDSYCLKNYVELDTSYQWPSQLQFLSLKVSTDSTCNSIGGIWNWDSVKNLSKITRIDLQNTRFSGYMNNYVWNMLLTELPNLEELDLEKTLFTTDFSEIALHTTSNIIRMDLDENINFYGTISSDFFSKLPNIEVLYLEDNVALEGYFENVDFLVNMAHLQTFDVENTMLGGSIKLSSKSLSLPATLDKFDIRATNFEYIDFSIFKGLNELYKLYVSNNSQLNGQYIDWDVIGSLSFTDLDKFYAEFVSWGGYADFSSIDESLRIKLDVDYLCDPQIYPCPPNQVPAPRSSSECEGKSECEATCKCSPATPEDICEELYIYIKDGVKRTQNDAQLYCKATFGSDLATIVNREELECAINLINRKSSPWIGLQSDETYGSIGFFTFIDDTLCADIDNGRFSGACLGKQFWYDSKPMQICKEEKGSKCVRLMSERNGRFRNDIKCDGKLPAILCNKNKRQSGHRLLLDNNKFGGVIGNDENNKSIFLNILFGGIISFILVSNVFVCYWCIGKQKNAYGKVKTPYCIQNNK